MDTPTPLLDRIEKKYRTERQPAKVIPFRQRRKPVWIERMESRGLPPKDYTEGPDAA